MVIELIRTLFIVREIEISTATDTWSQDVFMY